MAKLAITYSSCNLFLYKDKENTQIKSKESNLESQIPNIQY